MPMTYSLAGTLRDAAQCKAGEGIKIHEERHMQAPAMSLLKAILSSMQGGGTLFAADTHAQGLGPIPNKGRVDCSILASTTIPCLWQYLVSGALVMVPMQTFLYYYTYLFSGFGLMSAEETAFCMPDTKRQCMRQHRLL